MEEDVTLTMMEKNVEETKEIIHMVQFCQNPKEECFLNELPAQLVKIFREIKFQEHARNFGLV